MSDKNSLLDTYIERCKSISSEFLSGFPDSPAWITFGRESEGMIISVFDKTNSSELPVFVLFIRREDWRVLLDLMPTEWLSYPAQWYSDFERIQRQKEDSKK